MLWMIYFWLRFYLFADVLADEEKIVNVKIGCSRQEFNYGFKYHAGQ